jgi:hypothetical protein
VPQQQLPDHLQNNPVVVAAAFGLIGALVGGLLTFAGNAMNNLRPDPAYRAALDSKLLETSVSILRAPPTPETAPMRHWAVDVLEYSGRFSLTREQRDAFLSHALPDK